MAQYFNRESGSLAVTLRTGKACTIPGKSWVEIAAEDEGSEDLIRILQRGYVYRFDSGEEVKNTPETIETASSPEPVAEVSAPPAAETASPDKEEKQDPTSEKNSDLQRRKKV